MAGPPSKQLGTPSKLLGALLLLLCCAAPTAAAPTAAAPHATQVLFEVAFDVMAPNAPKYGSLKTDDMLQRRPEVAESWVESSLARVMPNTVPDSTRLNPGGQDVATLHLAGNEHESFQVALRPAVNTSYTVAWTPLEADLVLSWEQVGLVYVFEMMNNTDGPAGWWPDPVLRVPKAFGIQGISTAVWFTLQSPPNTKAGVYKSTITLTPTTRRHSQNTTH